MTTQEKLQAITKAIQEVCPVNRDDMVFTVSEYDYEVLGSPITLSHILRWLEVIERDSVRCFVMSTNGCINEMYFDDCVGNHYYNLQNDTLDQQSPEFIDFLYSLLPLLDRMIVENQSIELEHINTESYVGDSGIKVSVLGADGTKCPKWEIGESPPPHFKESSYTINQPEEDSDS